MKAFVDHLSELFAPIGAVQTRRMFGGHGVFYGGVMFALVVGDVLYLKADKETVGEFEQRGLDRFKYRRHAKWVKTSYFQAPAEMFDDPHAARVWAGRALEAARRSRPRPGGRAGSR